MNKVIKKYILKHQFFIGSIAIYCIPFICSLSLYFFYILIEKYSDLNSIPSSELYKHPPFWLGYIDIALGIISIIASAMIARQFWDLSKYTWVKWTSCIIVFAALFGFSVFVPWFKNNSRLHKKRVLLAVISEMRKGNTQNIAIRFNYSSTDINAFIDNRDFNTYTIENVSKDTVLSKIELPLHSIKILVASYFEKPTDKILGKIVISKKNKKNFYFIDYGGDFLGLDLDKIK